MKEPANRMEKFAIDRSPTSARTGSGANACPKCGGRGNVTHTYSGSGTNSPIVRVTTRRKKCEKCQHVWHTREEKYI